MKTISISDPYTEDLLARLANRHSVGPKYLTYPAPDLAQLETAAMVASRAPDHAKLRPFRFVMIGEHQRPRLAELFGADAAQRGQDAEAVKQARERAFNGPALIAMVVAIQVARAVHTKSVGENRSPFPRLSEGASVSTIDPLCKCWAMHLKSPSY